jgi:hypothetical protein
MGFYTGYVDRKIEQVQHKSVVGGLEYLGRSTQLEAYPYVIKHPMTWVGGKSVFQTIDQHDLEIQHMLVTTREPEALISSNMKFWHANEREHTKERVKAIQQEMRKVLPEVQKELFATIEEREIPYTVLEFPSIVQDKEYLFDNIKHIRRVTREKFDAAFDKLSDVNKVHF